LKKILAPQRIATTAGVALTVLSIVALWLGVPLLDGVELKTYDMRLRALQHRPVQYVTIAAIDEESLGRIGRWPWSRSTLAELARRLDEAGARVIAFDLFFPEHESAKADGQFARALGETRKAVLGTVFLLDREEVRYVGAGALQAAMEAIAPQAITDVRAGGEAPPALPEPYGVIVNIPELQARAAYAGHINVLPDADGVVRRIPLVVQAGGRYFPAFDLQVARAFYGNEPLAVELAPYGIVGVALGARQVPLDEDGRLLVRYRGRERTFPAVPIADILAGTADKSLLRDRVVLVGNTAKGIGDVRVTPYGTAFPGVEVRANIIENLIQGDVLHRPEWMTLVDTGLMLVAGLFLVWLLPRFGVSGAAMLAAATLAAYLALATYLFHAAGVWLNIVYPTLLVASLFAFATLVRYSSAYAERRNLKRAFQHYVPRAIVDGLVADMGRLRLGGDKRELTVLFSDIRGFTAMSERMDPEDLVKLMNEYFTAMTAKVFEHHGSLDKYIGDAIMAVYGAPVAVPQHPLQACRSALGMVEVLRGLRESWSARGLPAVDIGIGINTGPMVVGNMGSATRFNYTVIGDAVNLASRIEHLNKTYGTNILISEYTYEQVKDQLSPVREVDSVQVRGRAQPVRLYELIPPGKYASLDWLEEFGIAYGAMRGGELERAAALFESVRARSGDVASAIHARYCRMPHRRRAETPTAWQESTSRLR
jgi:adenylate cyclase